ncbi:MAG: ABC transporter ATP-binding protein [Deltaproteobacteria bacterium]|nr:ABC transporter ATP-binding protein [Deltaproteobacteria bacterium]
MESPSNDFAVTVDGLEKRFGDFVAVNKVSFSVQKGEIFGFLGPNGAGKSTTIKMLCGILAPTTGTGTVAGFDVFSEAEKIKNHIGYMSQKFSLYEDLTVEENIDFYSGIYRIPKAKKAERKEWVIEMAGLSRHRKSLTSILSGGWKQRLALGCAVIHEPPIIFLDEPTSGVDPVSRRRFWDLIYDLAGKGVTIFVTTHYMDEAEYCDRLGFIYRGELVALGSPETLKGRFTAGDIYDVRTDRPQDAISVAENMDGVREVALFGRGLHVVAAGDKVTAKSLAGGLATAGFKVEAVERITPSLEDVFVSLIEERDARDSGAESA